MSSGHENGYAFNPDQRGSHPPPFVTLYMVGGRMRPYFAMRKGEEWWWFYWNDGSETWVSLRPAHPGELRHGRELALPRDKANLYHARHEKTFPGSIPPEAKGP